jgi:sarcosine oxidase subunit alpha
MSQGFLAEYTSTNEIRRTFWPRSGGGAGVTHRLPEAPREGIRRDRPLSIVFEGWETPAFDGDTVGSALAAAGITITARSFKYHRPRGLLCMTGSCANCLMQVDGIPNVRHARAGARGHAR